MIDPTIEQQIVATAIFDNAAFDEIADLVRPEHFDDTAVRRLYEAALAMHLEGLKVDYPGLLLRKASHGWEFSQLAEMVQQYVGAPHWIREQAKVLRRRHDNRRLADIGRRLSEIDDTTDADALVHEVSTALASVGEAESSAAVSLTESVDAALERLDASLTSAGHAGGMGTGFRTLDAQTGRFRGGELIVIAARPGMGKTALALAMLEHMVMQARKPAAMFSLEMRHHELTNRLLSMASGVPYRRIRDAKVSREERTLLDTARDRMASGASLTIFDDVPMSVADIAARSMRLARGKSGLSAVFVDYLQLLRPANPKIPRHEQVAAMTRDLKCLAQRLDVPLFVLAQLNRQAAKAGTRPTKADLRESGSIEQDADVVLLIHREHEMTFGSQCDGLLRSGVLIVDKCRNGMTGDVPVRWIGDTVTFTECAQ